MDKTLLFIAMMVAPWSFAQAGGQGFELGQVKVVHSNTINEAHFSTIEFQVQTCLKPEAHGSIMNLQSKKLLIEIDRDESLVQQDIGTKQINVTTDRDGCFSFFDAFRAKSNQLNVINLPKYSISEQSSFGQLSNKQDLELLLNSTNSNNKFGLDTRLIPQSQLIQLIRNSGK